MIAFLLDEPVEIDDESWTKAMVKGKAAPEMLDATIAGLDALGTWAADDIRTAIEAAAVNVGLVNAEGQPQLSKAQGPSPRGHHRSLGGTSAVRITRSARARAHPRSPAGRPSAPLTWSTTSSVLRSASPDDDRRWGLAVRLVGVVLLICVVYVGVTFVMVYRASRHDGARAADAVVVLGAAQYNGQPSPVLQDRLDHALELYEEGLAAHDRRDRRSPGGRRVHRGHDWLQLPARPRRARRGAAQGGRRQEHLRVAGGLGPLPP